MCVGAALMANPYPVFTVTWPDGSLYVGVRPRDTVASFTDRLKIAAKMYGATPMYTNSLARKCHDTDGPGVVDIAATFDSQSEALEYANKLIAATPDDKRLNERPLTHSQRRE
jgi:hypothetical protein